MRILLTAILFFYISGLHADHRSVFNCMCVGPSAVLLPGSGSEVTTYHGAVTRTINMEYHAFPELVIDNATLIGENENISLPVSDAKQDCGAKKYSNGEEQIHISTSTQVLCVGESATLIATGAQYLIWNNGHHGDTLVIRPAATRTYSVSGTNIYGCKSGAIYMQQVSACDNVTDRLFNIYPNPSADKFFIRMEQSKDNVWVSIYNDLGRLIRREQMQGKQMTIDLSGEPDGIYLLRFRQGQELQFHRLLKKSS